MKMQKNKKLVQAAAVGLSVCVLAGGGLFVWNMYGKNAEENEKQIVSDFGPIPLTPITSRNISKSSFVKNPKSCMASSRTFR